MILIEAPPEPDHRDKAGIFQQKFIGKYMDTACIGENYRGTGDWRIRYWDEKFGIQRPAIKRNILDVHAKN